MESLTGGKKAMSLTQEQMKALMMTMKAKNLLKKEMKE